MTTQAQSAADAAEIRRILAVHVVGLHDKNLEAAMAHIAADILCYDLAPPLVSRGADVYRRNLEAWFPTWDGPIDYEAADLEITLGDDVAFTTGLNRIGGRKVDGDTIGVWVRVTAGFRKIDGRWTLTHEHVSVPYYMDGSLKAAVDLRPA